MRTNIRYVKELEVRLEQVTNEKNEARRAFEIVLAQLKKVKGIK